MPTELWGTFSVRDHVAARAFVADVLLYDRLIIPTLPEGSDPKDWLPEWDLAKQRRVLDVLGEVAIPIPWTADRQEQWQRRFDAITTQERGKARVEVLKAVTRDQERVRNASELDEPYMVTRELLTDLANQQIDDELFRRLRATQKARPGSTLEAVMAYSDFDAFRKDVSIDTFRQSGAPTRAPTDIFGWDFFVPASTKQGDAEDLRLLKTAVTLSRRSEFVEHRAEFYNWLSDISEGKLEREKAVEDMERRIKKYTEMMKKQRWMKLAKRAIKIVDAFAGGLGLVNEVAGAAAEVFLGSAEIVFDERPDGADVPPPIKVAAMFHDARSKFGWKPLN